MVTSSLLTFQVRLEHPVGTQQDSMVPQQAQGISVCSLSHLEVLALPMVPLFFPKSYFQQEHVPFLL